MINFLSSLLSPILEPMGVSQADLTSYLTMLQGYVWAIIGIIAIGCIVGYLVYRHFSPDYLEDFDDEFEDDEFEDEDFFADEADN